jgi:RNA polymerase sigma-70 factor (ECF subfamily)
MSEGSLSDAEVIARCQRGEVEPFSILVRRYQDRVYHLTLRLLENADDALDAAQEAFLRAFSALSRFDLERPFAPWLTQIAANVSIGMLRKRRPGTVFLDALAEEEADTLIEAAVGARDWGDPQRQLDHAIREEAIQRAVLALPEPYRTVVLLRHLEEMSYEAISAALEMPLGTVKTHLHRARERLRRALSEELQ